jgi:DNA (cytosine-5)-methyltransferase 1
VIFGSVCSGIEAASVAWHPLGWQAAFYAEIEPYPRTVLQHHYPEVPCHGDFTTIQNGQYRPIDLLVGGTPCQSFSIAGLRGGMADARGNLALEYLRLADRLRPRWLVWENVPGVLSSNGGRDFGSFLGGLAELGYGWAYRSLDAQYFGLAQRRQRVFVVGYLGDWRRAAAVLFESASLRGHPAPRRKAGQEAAPTLACGSYPTGGRTYGLDVDTCESLVARCLDAHPNRLDGESETFVVAHTLRQRHDAGEDGTGRGTPLVVGTLTGNGGAHSGFKDELGLVPVYAIQERAVSENPNAGPQGKGWQENTSYTLEARHHAQSIAHQMGVRRLTPRECERLQGFPDDYTLIPYRGGMAADGPRYKALGNSMAVPVMRWIGRRIERQTINE